MSAAWADALLAARIFAADPLRLGGIRVRARAGPLRDEWLERLRHEIGDGRHMRKVPASIAADRLAGGIDITATLAAGRPVEQPGLLAEARGGILVIPMAERMAPHLAAALIPEIDSGSIALILLDEGEGSNEAPPAAVVERMGLTCALDGVTVHDVDNDEAPVACGDSVGDPVDTLCRVADAFGIFSARAPVLALATARLMADLSGRKRICEGDVDVAVRLALLPRATKAPAPPDETPREPGESAAEQAGDGGRLADRIVETAMALLPAGVLDGLRRSNAATSRHAGRGSAGLRKSLTRGRPVGVRPGRPGAGGRLHLVETLRAAAPWQRLRAGAGVQIRASDFRIRKFADKSEATLIFVVDASGSAAAERMAEAKGAAELLLADAYVKRTQVALIGFRGDGAELLLPPTRSLVRAKRELAQMAGGGGTPLAAGIEAGQVLAEAERERGRTPFLVLMTDGRANVARNGETGRSAADADTRRAAKVLGASGIKSVVIDIASRPRNDAREVAAAMAADYATLPRADARATQAIVGALTA